MNASTQSGAVLVVEDEPDIRRFIETSLRAAGYAVESASTGRDALALLAKRQAALLVLDLGLPDIDGTDVIRAVRAHSATPIIVLSAQTDEPQKIRALDLGADDYLTKPFGVGELLARIRVAFRRATPGERQAPLRARPGP